MQASFNEQIIRIIEEAGAAILAVKDHHVVAKVDGSPVTAADHAAHELVMRELPRISSIPIISEEAETFPGEMPGEFWLLDPLDGTKELLKDSGEFTVNLALIRDRRPVMGVVHLPASDVTYLADGGGAFVRRGAGELEPVRARRGTDGIVRIAVSRDHITSEDEGIIAKFEGCDRIPAGSALKLCLVADGSADLYVRCGNTMEWDIAAAHAVLEAAGGILRTLDGEELLYGKANLLNPGFVAACDEELLERALA